MSTEELRHRSKDDQSIQQEQPNVIKATTTATPTTQQRKKTGTARRGLRSLSVAIAFPLTLTLLNIYLFGSTTRYRSLHKPFYYPPLWALHLACVTNALLTGVSAWLVWADGGFHRRPNALMFYLGQLVLSIAWYPVVFGAGMVRVGLALCVGLIGVMFGCARSFGGLNLIAGDLVKPCFVWPVLLAAVNARLLYH